MKQRRRFSGAGRLRDSRLSIIIAFAAVGWIIVAAKLFSIQVLGRERYAMLAAGQRETSERLVPERGEIMVRDRRSSDGWFPIATNRLAYTIYAVPRDIVNPSETARRLAPILELDVKTLQARLAKNDDPYESLRRSATEAQRDAVLALRLPGVTVERVLSRYYPDGPLAAHLTGFVGEDERGVSGRYGLEGAADALLSGSAGFIEGERDPQGRWIIFKKRAGVAAQNGADLRLTIERELQHAACRSLEKTVRAYGAKGGAVVILHPMSGAVRAFCGVPSFDPNRYGATTDLFAFSALATSGAYEPGSVFKPITMAAAIDVNAVEPATRFGDEGSVIIDGSKITNTDGRIYGERTMADVLRFSINTGAVFAARALGIDRFRAAMDRFGFGVLTDIELAGESSGDISALAQRREIYLATASYGQGITVTPLQLAVAYAALANNGKLFRPYLIEEVIEPNGTRRRTEQRVIRQAVSPATAAILQGMLVSVVRDGYPKRAGVAGYLIGGKTGTAQIPLRDRPGYADDTIHTFAGFGPIDHPSFAMVVRLDRPQTQRFADSTAAPLFGEIAKFILEYDGIPPRTELSR